MNLKEFAADFTENILISIEIEGRSQEDEITNDIIDYINRYLHIMRSCEYIHAAQKNAEGIYDELLR